MLYVFPIEPLEERYSAQWMRWTEDYLNESSHPSIMIHPSFLEYNEIRQGSFLDVINTNIYKNLQMRMILEYFDRKEIKDGDIFWFHDIWFPGLEMLAYIRNALGINFKIYGCIHAGTYDKHDFLTKKGMRFWGKHQEAAWFSFVDGIFVATEFHKKLLKSNSMGLKSKKIHVTGFPMYPDEFMWGQKNPHDRENIIVFPHRLDEEKNPKLFDTFQTIMHTLDWGKKYQFIFTKKECRDKDEYYDILKRAKFAVSFAMQETWGIAMQEAVLCGCIPLVPDRLSYREMYPDIFRYKDDIIEMIHLYINNPKYTGVAYFEVGKLQYKFREEGRTAFDNMFNIMFGE